MARPDGAPRGALTEGAARGGLAAFRGIVRSGLLAVLLHPLSSAVSVGCLVATIAPFLLAEGLSRGIAAQAEDAVREGADLYVSGERFGRPVPVPRTAAELLRKIPGVREVEARIVGQTELGIDRAPVLWIGVAAERLPGSAELVEGRMWNPGAANELVVGSELARRLGLTVDAVIPPFYRNESGERLSRVVGIFRSDLPAWQAHVVLSSFDTAAHVFADEGVATSFLVRCPELYREPVRGAVMRLPSLAPEGEPPLRPRAVTRDEVRALVESRVHLREGAFAIPFVLAFALGVPLLLVTTGLGLVERRREAGLLKALGWRSDEVVTRSLVESLTLAALGTAGAVLVVWIWVRAFGAAGVAKLFLPDADLAPGFDVPFRLVPEPFLVAAAAACIVTSAGSLLSSWRAASAAPAEAVR